jgi:hypothetical protein
MEKINDLLEKYFAGVTSLQEEQELKKYFAKGNVATEHELYRSLFEVFEKELKETAILPFEKVIHKQSKTKNLRMQSFIYYGIAASLLFVLWIQIPKSSDNYVVINGNKIDNSEYAQRYAMRKLNKVSLILAKSMEPMQNIDLVRKSLKPMHDISLIKEKMDETQYKLQIKQVRI